MRFRCQWRGSRIRNGGASIGILHASAFGQHIFVLNGFPDAVELLEKRASIYSSRPALPLMQMMGWTFNSGLLPYGDTWRPHRKVLQQGLRKDVLEPYQPKLTTKTGELLQNLAAAP
ncbi:hypothetical protein BDN72DRAFT_217017 [Pluteus cervinus]|uniref:Uncharacterized protein n=1 Tax=Pluteus cervinus TaxID=181527 RepID=A0ACD3B5Q7_9AGAR|nr:hypothetical protein BDN72DRAFT_217017 [Pluteus cervinus]